MNRVFEERCVSYMARGVGCAAAFCLLVAGAGSGAAQEQTEPGSNEPKGKEFVLEALTPGMIQKLGEIGIEASAIAIIPLKPLTDQMLRVLYDPAQLELSTEFRPARPLTLGDQLNNEPGNPVVLDLEKTTFAAVWTGSGKVAACVPELGYPPRCRLLSLR